MVSAKMGATDPIERVVTLVSDSTDPIGSTADEKSAPKYLEILDGLRSQIVNGQIKYNEKLPIEPELMKRHAASRPTVHRAMVELELEGLVELRRGVGAFARHVRPVVRNIGKRFSSEVWRSGKSVWAQETEGRAYGFDSGKVERTQAPARVAELLGVTDAWARYRRHLIDGAPVMLSVSYYPADIVEGSQITEADTGPGGSPARLDELGHGPRENSERFRYRHPTDDERKRLQLPRGTDVVEITRVCWDANDRAVEVTEMVANVRAFEFQVDYTS